MPVADSLAGTTIVVTRPAHQADSLCKLINDHGGKTIRFPVLEITTPPNALSPQQIQSKLTAAHLLIFISPNAVDYGMKSVAAAGGIPAAVKVAAVGQGTANKLAAWKQHVDIFPSKQFNSEALLAMHELQRVDGQNIVIFRGVGGRELLADSLRQRGAHVDYIECYQRIRPNTDSSELSEQLSQESVDAVVVTSNEGLQNLYDMLRDDDRLRLLKAQLFVVSERAKELAHTLGFLKPAIVVSKASDEGILAGLLENS